MLQAVGPIRVKADYQFYLESSIRAVGGSSFRGMGGILDHLKCTQPSLKDVQYGIDFAVPGSYGAVRAGAWYTPSRKEGMMELRIM